MKELQPSHREMMKAKVTIKEMQPSTLMADHQVLVLSYVTDAGFLQQCSYFAPTSKGQVPTIPVPMAQLIQLLHDHDLDYRLQYFDVDGECFDVKVVVSAA